MSKKRFTIKPQNDYWAVVDNHDKDKICIINGIHTEIEAKWLCDFMNELSEENEQLRKDKAQLKERLRECRIKMDKFNCR